MAITPYSSRLRYLDAAQLETSSLEFDHLPVYGWERQKLGHLDGFIVDAETGGVYYAVVHGGSWFDSRRFLVPIGHVYRLDPVAKELHVDVSKDAIRVFPAFDKDKFLEFSDEDMRAFERQMAAACCPSAVPVEAVVFLHETIAHYREPSWWPVEFGEPQPTAPQGRGHARPA
jgi:hypothetical protein